MSIMFRASTSASGTSSAVLTLPPALRPGDGMLIFAVVNGAATLAAPPGWTLVDSRAVGTNVSGRVFARAAQAGDAGAAVNVTNDGAAGVKSAAVLVAYAGIDPLGPVHVSGARTETASGNAHATPAVTTTAGQCWAVQAAVSKDAGTAWTPPSGTVLRQQVFAGGTGQVTAAVADGNGPHPAGPVGGAAFTSTAATADAITWTVALRPEIPVAAVFPDVEAAVASYLTSRPEMAGIPVGSSLPSGHDGTTPAVVLIRDGGSYREDEALDDAQLRIETYGPGVTGAHEVMRRVRALLAGLPSHAFPGFVIGDVTEEGHLRGLRRLTDRTRPEFTRYCLNVHLLVHMS
ncbi:MULTISPECIES: hypothetical protein [Actinomadura]|uniref:Uncharacterized protein n=1 Tax=Actinomadura yumaensis TaxID=111807 RepID=A0ABW2CS98_9ACTN|nr:hypothetical protein [Actinomadura sp. J1-007]MWK37610.1 hypothetical protein [Actinomadura sp. J1-007]